MLVSMCVKALARDKEQHSAWELFGYKGDSNEAAFAFAAVEKIYAHESLTFNNTVACEAEIWATKGLLDKTKRNILGMEIVEDQSGNTLGVSQSMFYNKKLLQNLLERHSILSLEGSLSGDCDVEKNATCMTLTEAAKEAIWLKGLAIESGFKLKIVAGIATGALFKAIPGSRFQHELVLFRIEDF
nr:zinc finger, CCHC-type [Tanacetum cinerariifolium]